VSSSKVGEAVAAMAQAVDDAMRLLELTTDDALTDQLTGGLAPLLTPLLESAGTSATSSSRRPTMLLRTSCATATYRERATTAAKGAGAYDACGRSVSVVRLRMNTGP
jgi:hypothetical protein